MLGPSDSILLNPALFPSPSGFNSFFLVLHVDTLITREILQKRPLPFPLPLTEKKPELFKN